MGVRQTAGKYQQQVFAGRAWRQQELVTMHELPCQTRIQVHAC